MTKVEHKATKKLENLLNGKVQLSFKVLFEDGECIVYGTSPDFLGFRVVADCPDMVDALIETIELYFEVDEKKARRIALNSLEAMEQS